MGCWNGTCGLTNMPIRSGERAVVIPLAQRSDQFGIACYCHDLCQIAGFAIRGKYNDYGTLEEIDQTPGALKTIELFKAAVKDKELTLAIPEHDQREYKGEITTPEMLLRLIERGYVTCKTQCWGGPVSPINRDLSVSFMMIHEAAFDEIIKEVGGRIGYNEKTSFIKHLEKVLEERKESFKKNKNRFLFSPEDTISRWMSETFMFGKYLSHEPVPQDLKDPVIELYLFETAMGLLRKNLMPACGAGSQSGEYYLHKVLASYTIQKEEAIRKDHAEDYENDPEIDDCTKETFLF